MKRLLVLILVAAGFGVGLPACSSFDADHARGMEVLEAQPVAGAWVGRWQSQKGHGGGELRAIIEPADKAAVAATRNYTGRFKARWGFFTSEYTAPVAAKTDMRRMSTVTFHSETDLGFFAGGKYTMDGESTPTTLTATYKSASGDEGTIEMVRK